MNIDEYLNDLQSSLDRHLSRFGTGEQSSNRDNNPEAPGEIKFCPECGTQMEADANFCPNCGYNFNAYEQDDSSQALAAGDSVPAGWNDSDENEGILWTDTVLLAEKYDVDSGEIEDILIRFIDKSEEQGITWHLLDMAEYETGMDGASWMDYSESLENFMDENSIQAGPHLSLFIIGGNDVIPQPAVANPCNGNTEWDENDYEDHVYADIFYCFFGQLSLDFLDFRRARCNVARLPLETGSLETSPESDLGDYLDSCIEMAESDGIRIGRAVMTSNSDWIPASREMSRNLPTEHMDNEEDVVLDNMFLSPNIMKDMDENLKDQYFNKLSEADMLVFNLHGSCDPNHSGFYSTGLAFSIDMLNRTSAKVFNTVACWGGRYIKYTREQSMLLSAIYSHGILLYCGSCVPALGKCGHFQHDGTWRIQPAAYSETFMARFSEYECLGKLNAGEAFLKAKCDYYNSSRMVEEDEYILGTMLMFNLYGNPKLRTMPDEEAIAGIQEDDGSKHRPIPFRRMKRTVVMVAQKQTSGTMSFLEEVRGLVDSNLRAIHETITRNLYNKLGVEPRELHSVESYETIDINGNPEKGYLYNYDHSSGSISSRIQARVNQKGCLIDAIQTK
ncbi:MAG: zinc ribbon domain-containing protein [Candidatus Cryptobacteroides sp.]|nr:zinc ribbon domain-containing protein [Bacteroidales bacterium]MDY6158032.1 zinc ribbon domain-containing protein [Candidatus Cryptobacteroides sp.]